MSELIRSQIRHRVRFAPDPKATSFPTDPVFVESRLIRDITEYPEGVTYVTFDDIVETEIRLPDGTTQVVYSEPFNDSLYFVRWTREEAKELHNNGWKDLVEVHPKLRDKVFVIQSSHEQTVEQRAA